MMTPADALRRLVEVLDRLAIPYMVGGSVASSIHGMARPTMGVDLVAALQPSQVDRFAAELRADFCADPETIRAALEQGRPFNLIHYASTFKFDVFPALPDPYHQIQLQRRLMTEATQFGEVPVRCAVATAEDTLLAKLEWYRAGGETSERQWNDLWGESCACEAGRSIWSTCAGGRRTLAWKTCWSGCWPSRRGLGAYRASPRMRVGFI